MSNRPPDTPHGHPSDADDALARAWSRPAPAHRLAQILSAPAARPADDVPRMRTGLVGEVERDEMSESLARMLGLVVLLIEEAKLVAGTLATHANSEEVEVFHVNAAMRHLIYRGTFFNDPQIETKLENLMEETFGPSDEDESSDCSSESGDDDGSKSETDATQDDNGEWFVLPPTMLSREGDAGGACRCALCVSARDAVEAWDDWQPEDDVLIFLKQHFDNASAVAMNASPV